jgi:hypothetical protein
LTSRQKGLLDDEEGKLALALRAWLEEVETSLDETFDENSKKSAIAKLETVRKEQVRSVKQLLDPDNDESPLCRWRSEIVKTVKEEGRSIEEALDHLREQLQVADAKEEVFGQTAVKGFTFEQVVLAQLDPIATAHEDVPEHVGDAIGSDGSKVGDIVISVNSAETPGRAVRYVIEAKDKSMTLKKALDELDAAMRNRNAEAGLMVFASQAASPVKEPFQCFDHRALVVLDKETLDACALRLGCLWARWTARREDAEACDTIDAVKVQALIDTARLSLRAATAIKGDHTKARTAIEHASGHLVSLINDLKGTLDQLELEVADPE